jgi:hypothetical protein
MFAFVFFSDPTQPAHTMISTSSSMNPKQLFFIITSKQLFAPVAPLWSVSHRMPFLSGLVASLLIDSASGKE